MGDEEVGSDGDGHHCQEEQDDRTDYEKPSGERGLFGVFLFRFFLCHRVKSS